MKSKLPVFALAAVAMMFGTVAQADVLQRVKSSGTLRIGMRTDNGGISYDVGDGNFGGFHHDLCMVVVRDLEKQLGQKIRVQITSVSAQTRLPQIIDGVIDMECGATTNNAARQQHVAFAVTTYVEEVRVAVRANSGIHSVADLNGKSVATTLGTTSLPLLRKQNRAKGADIREVIGRNDVESFALMAEGKADAYVMDGQMVASFISNSKKPSDFRLLGEVLSVEPIAIMLPKNDPTFKKAVDDSLKALMRSGEIQSIYNKWLMDPIPPNQTRIGLPVSEATRKAWADPNDRPLESY